MPEDKENAGILTKLPAQPQGENEEANEEANEESIRERLEEIAGQALMATKEGKLDWEESFRPSAFRAGIDNTATAQMDLEILRDVTNGRVKLVLRDRGNLVASFHPKRQDQMGELLEELHRNTVRKSEKVRKALERITALLTEDGQPPPEATTTKRTYIIWREITARDEDDHEVDLETEIHFWDAQGSAVNWDFWEEALDYFLQYDTLNELMQDGDYWHSRVDFLLTGTAFKFDLEALDPEAPRLALEGEAIRYVATESMGGDLNTMTDQDSIVSRVKFRIHFVDTEKARPVLSHIKDEE